MEVGANAEAMEGVLLTGLIHLPCSQNLSYRTHNHQPKSDPIHNGLGPPTSITK